MCGELSVLIAHRLVDLYSYVYHKDGIAMRNCDHSSFSHYFIQL